MLKVDCFGFFLALLVLPTASPASGGARDELRGWADRDIVEVAFSFRLREHLIAQKNGIWAFQEAARQPWQGDGPPAWSVGADSAGATLSVRFSDGSSAKRAVTMVEKGRTGVYYPVHVGSAWCHEDSLLSRLITCWVTERLPREPDIRFTDDRKILGGFTPFELKMLDFPELTVRVLQERIKKGIEQDVESFEGRRDVVSALLQLASSLKSAGNYGPALECVDRAEKIPHDDDVLPEEHTPWKLRLRDICLTQRADVYIAMKDFSKANDELQAQVALRRSNDWVPKTDDSQILKRFHERNGEALRSIEKRIKICQEQMRR